MTGGGGEGALGIQWLDTRNAAKHPMAYRTAPPPTTKKHPVQNVNSAEIEKLSSRLVCCGMGEGQEGHQRLSLKK